MTHRATQATEENIAATPDHGKVPGTVIDYSPASSGAYIGSPSIAVLPDGAFVASHDLFGPGSGNDTSRVFRSEDEGRSWQLTTTLKGQWWSNLFVHRENLYILGTSKVYGNVVIRRSTDGGRTWTEPIDETSGLLRKGAYHTAPCPIVEHSGRLWRGFEDRHAPGGWGHHFRAFVFSAPIDADLLRADAWTDTAEHLPYDKDWGGFGWLEGNAVVDPDGNILNILRNANFDTPNQAAVVRVYPGGRHVSFDPGSDFVHLPGANTKFHILHDGKTGLYWALTNPAPELPETGAAAGETPRPERDPASVRNTLALYTSTDLRAWNRRAEILHHPDPDEAAFQYPAFVFHGDDILAVSRTAYDDGVGGAHNFHDANYLTFHRIENFRRFAATAP